MNSSYKIVLLGAFVLFTAVVGYYVVFGGDPSGPAEQDGPAPAETADERPTLAFNGPDTTNPNNLTPRSPLAHQDPPARATPETIVIDTDPIIDPLNPPTPPAGEGSPEAADPATPPAVGEGPTRDGPRAGDPDPAAPTDPEAAPATPSRDGPGAAEEPIEIEPETPVVEPAPRRPVPPAPTRTISRTYTVKAGDTLSSIALQIYGEENAWFAIAQANPSIDPKRLQVDQVIVLPDSNAPDRTTDEPRPPAPGQDQRYTVRPGDNLSKIAKRFYGDSEAWDLIYNRNRNKIGSRPDNLKVGMELIIPQPYNGAE